MSPSSMYRWTRVPAGSHREIHPSTRRMRNSRRRDVAKPSSLVSEFTCCYATSSPCPNVTATSTRFHRTVIDRGRRCGSRPKSTPPRSAARHSFNVLHIRIIKTFHIFRPLNFFIYWKKIVWIVVRLKIA